MKESCIVSFLYWLGLLLIAGCSAQNTTDMVGVSEQEFDEIIGSFSYHAPPLDEPGAPHEPSLNAPVDPLKRRLSHSDPLTLAGSKLIIAGSDTLSPVTQEMITLFHKEGYRGDFRMNKSSTGVGIKALCRAETMDLVNASRTLKAKEAELCKDNGVVPVQIKIGYDPFVLITNRQNYWMNSISREQLSLLFKSTSWSDVNLLYPANPINFYLPRKEGGAMETMSKLVYDDIDAPYIREVESGQFYPYNLELTRDLGNDIFGIGFASYGKLTTLKQLNIRVVPVGGAQPVIAGSAYPLNRSLYLITSVNALRKSEMQVFIAHYLNVAADVMPSHGFAPLDGTEALREQQAFLASLENETLSDLHVTLSAE